VEYYLNKQLVIAGEKSFFNWTMKNINNKR
jgi:hypothetical protein